MERAKLSSAIDSLHRLLGVSDHDEARISLTLGPNTETIHAPKAALEVFAEALDRIEKGHEVVLMSVEKELTTQEAADVLGVSRPYLIKLLNAGDIPFRKVGTKRRIRLKDLLAYKTRIDDARGRVLDELVAQGQELDMGY